MEMISKSIYRVRLIVGIAVGLVAIPMFAACMLILPEAASDAFIKGFFNGYGIKSD